MTPPWRTRIADWLDALPGRLWGTIRRLRVVTLVAVIVAGAVALTLFALAEDDRSLREGSTVVSDEGRPLDVDGAPAGYRILYRVENRGGGELVERTEEVWVRRPFDGRVEERPGRPPGEGEPAVTITRFGEFVTLTPGSEPTAFHVPPNPPAGDLPGAEALEAAREAGLVELRERRRISAVDRECQVYRLGGPVGGGLVVPVGTTEGEHADVCVDAEGLVLEEVDVVDRSRVLRRRVAVEVEERPSFPADVFEFPDVRAPPADQGGGSVLEVEADSRPAVDEFFEPVDPPPPFRHRGRYAVVPPQAEVFADPLKQGQRVAGVADVWVAGSRFVIVDQGGTLGRVDAFEPHPYAVTERGGRLGDVELILGLRTSEVRTARPGGRYVRVYGTASPEALMKFARSLRARPGDGLEFLEDDEAAT